MLDTFIKSFCATWLTRSLVKMLFNRTKKLFLILIEPQCTWKIRTYQSLLLSGLHELFHANFLAEVPGIHWMASLWAYHRFRFIRDFGKQNTRGNVSKMRAIDRSDRNPPITATRCDLLTFATSCYGALIGGFRSDLSQARPGALSIWSKIPKIPVRG